MLLQVVLLQLVLLQVVLLRVVLLRVVLLRVVLLRVVLLRVVLLRVVLLRVVLPVAVLLRVVQKLDQLAQLHWLAVKKGDLTVTRDWLFEPHFLIKLFLTKRRILCQMLFSH